MPPEAVEAVPGSVVAPTRSGFPGVMRSNDGRRAMLALLLACLVWGGSFTWAKSAIATINVHAGRGPQSTLGPMLLLAWRFLLAGVAWLAIFRKSRRGWTWRSAARVVFLGAIFAVGMIAQQWGLS